MTENTKQKPKTDRAKDFKKTLFRLMKYLRPRMVSIIIITVAAVFATLFNVISPKLLGDATSSLFETVTTGIGVDFEFIGRLLLLLLGLYLLSAFFSFIQQYVMASVGQKTSAELRQAVNDKLSRLPLGYYDQHSHGDLLSRAVNDVDNINTSLQQALTQVITSVISIVGIIIMMLILSPILTVVVVLTIPLSLIIVKYVATYSQQYFKKQQDELGSMNGHIEEMFSGHHVVKAFGHEKRAKETFDTINESLYKASWKAQFFSGIMMPLMTFVSNIGYVLVSITGGILVISGNIRIGDVQAFIQYSQQISQPMGHVASIANMIQSAIASAERIFTLLDEPEEEEVQEAVVDIQRIAGNVTFEAVQFGYRAELPIINDFNLEVKAGQTVAIVGPTGAGKTTVINLLMRFYEIDQGAIRVDGMNIQRLSKEQVRQIFAMVLQDTWLFNGTIRENIAYGRKGATDEEIIQAAKNAYADDFIRTLPDGYDTILGEDATNISQGQKQLLTIARAILSNPKVLILDEATSNVDTRTEMKIQMAMKDLMQGRTSFVIAHRLSTVRDADIILVMKQGSIVEKGTHKQLLEKKGFYSELYESQFAPEQAS